MRYWVLKSEPDVFSIDHLVKQKHQSTLWDGVRNFTARNNLVAMEVGDIGYFYHSSCPVPAIVGEMTVIAKAEPDQSAFDPKSAGFDAKSNRERPQWFSPQFKFVRKYETQLSREMLAGAGLLESQIFKSFRLSVIPITAAEHKKIQKLVTQGKRK